jgi:tRNA A-37 threonylcarbamoyl transferase component Bud32
VKYNPGQDQTQSQDTVRCPTCGMYVNRLISKCPQDGTILVDEIKGAFAERYEFLESLGTGGMSIIYKARHRVLNRIVAIKMMHEHMMNEQAVRRFQQEGQSASSLDHPNIVKVHDFGLTDRGQPYMVMDLVEGRSLSQVLDELGELPITQCLMIFIDICDALIHAHEKGILHRDLKPSNIMLTTTYERPTFAKLVDFGIAKIMEDEGGSAAMKLTQTGELFGSPPYMSPEQCYGRKVDRRSDIYSLGCLMFECLTGRTPFEGDTFVEILSKQMTAKAPLLHEVRADKKYPSHLEDVIDKCLAKQPESRFRTIDEVRSKLISIQEEVDDGLQRENGSLRQVIRSISQWKVGALVLIAGLVIVGGAALGFSNYRAGHAAERKALTLEKAKFLPLMRTNAITSDVLKECLSENAGLKSLNLHNTKIDDRAAIYIDNQVELTKLDMHGTAITNEGLLALKDLHGLTDLNLNSTKITSDGLAVLQSMPDLKKLTIRNTKIDAKAIPYIAHLKNLEDLDISRTEVTGPCFAPLGKLPLETLNRSALRLKVSDLASLKGFQKLRHLSLSDCDLDNSEIQYLSPLPALSNLEIHATKFGDDCVQYLSKLSHLKTLDMSTTKFTNKGLETLSKTLDLYEIHMRDDAIDQQTMDILSNFHDLHILDIANCYDVDDALVKKIATIKTITSLNISADEDTKKKSRLTTQAIGTIANGMPQLIDLDLSGAFTTFEKQSLADLAKMKNLRALHLKDIYIEKGDGHENLRLLKLLLPNCDVEI